MNLEILIAFGIYFTILGFIGFAAYKRSLATADFTLGSRSLSYWVTALAAHASDMSGWLFMGFPAAIYTHGLIEAWTAIGLTFFMYLNWKFVAPKLRTQTEQFHSPTLSSFFEKRFNDSSGILRIVSALFCLLFFTFYISANFVALGHLFESIFNIPYTSGIIIGSLVVFYILLGGYLSIAWVDFFQGLFLLGMILLVPACAYLKLGSFDRIVQAAYAKQISLALLPHSFSQFFSIVMLAAGWGLGYFGQPHIITKFMGIKHVGEMKKAQRVGLSWQAITLVAAICVGLIGIAYFPTGLENKELIFVVMTKQLFKPFFAGIILCAILASAINVIGAQVLVSASILTEDFYKRMMDFSSRLSTLWASRISVLCICFIAMAYALYNQQESIYSLIYYAWAGLGCSFGPLMLVSLHTQISNRFVALAGILAGGITAAVWPQFNSSILSMIPGYFASFAAMGIVYVMTKEK